MKWYTFIVFSALVVTLFQPAHGAGLEHLDCWPDCIKQYCCDDYCPKGLPCVCPLDYFERDDYCRRKLPVTCATLCWKCDDYCPKRLPRVCCPPFLKCPQAASDRAFRQAK